MCRILTHLRIKIDIDASISTFTVITMHAPARNRPRPLRRVPLRGVDDPPRRRAARCSPRTPPTPRSPAPPPALAAREFEVAAHTDGRARPPTSSPAPHVLVIAHPSDPKWEATVNGGSPLLDPAEIDAIEAFVAAGGGLVVLGETEQDKYGNNVNELLARFGVEIENATVQDYEHHHDDTPSWVLASLGDARRRPPDGPTCSPASRAACFYRAGASRPTNGARSSPARTRPPRCRTPPLAAVGRARRRPRRRPRRLRPLRRRLHRRARPRGALAQPRLLGRPARASPPRERPARSADRRRPRLDPPQGRGRGAAPHPGSPTARSTPPSTTPTSCATSPSAIAESAQALKPRFPHQHDYIDALAADLLAWADGGFGKPAFDRSTEAFRPERDRRDGIEHLVVFPMYKQNASRDTCFEALVVRVPWPEWIAELECDALRQRQVRAGHLRRPHLAATTPSAPSSSRRRSPPPSGRRVPLRRDLLRPRGRALPPRLRRRRRDPPPQPAARRRLPARLAASSPSRAYILWDLVHDRTHMRGDLPFDPFMIRQRSPYWMYSLEELRCDLTAFGDGGRARARGLRLRPPRPVRDPLRPPLPLPGHRLARAQLRRPRRPAALRLPAPRGLPALDRQPPDDRLGHGSPRASTSSASASRTSTTPASTARSSASGSPPTTWSPSTSRRPRARSGPPAAATCPRSRSRSSSSTWSATTSSRSASSTRSCSRSSSRRSPDGPAAEL